MVRSNNYTVVRLVLATMVLYSHSFALTGHEEPTILSRSFGNFAVHGFFAISGYLIAGSFLGSRSTYEYSIKRSLRIFPALMLGYWFSVYMGQLHGGFVSNPVPYINNGSIWTLPWEMLMYLGVGVLGAMGMLERGIVGALLATSLLIFFLSFGQPNAARDVVAPLAILFLGGAFLRLSRDAIDGRVAGLASCAILGALFLPGISSAIAQFAGGIPFVWGPAVDFWIVRLVVYLIALPFAIIFICQYFPISLPLKHDYSYGVYIFAWPVQQVVVWHAKNLGWSLTPLELFAVAGAGTMVLAVISWHVVESPAMRLRSLVPVLVARWRGVYPAPGN